MHVPCMGVVKADRLMRSHCTAQAGALALHGVAIIGAAEPESEGEK